MTDMLGTNLKIGDIIAYTLAFYGSPLHLGVITGETPKMVIVDGCRYLHKTRNDRRLRVEGA